MVSVLWFEDFGVVVITFFLLAKTTVEISCLNTAMQ